MTRIRLIALVLCVCLQSVRIARADDDIKATAADVAILKQLLAETSTKQQEALAAKLSDPVLRERDLVFAEVPLVLRYDLKSGRTKMLVLRVFASRTRTLCGSSKPVR